MNALVQSLAALSGLRDRDALDAALVRLVISSSEGAVHSATLVRVVGEGDDRRCLVQARLDAGQTQVSRDLLWTDWTTLPHVSDFPLRQLAVDRARAVHAETAPYTGVIPLLTAQGTWGLLEFGTEQPLSAAMLDLVEGILLTYNNLLGLLDYGEKDALTELLNRKTFDGAFFKATAEQHGDELPDGGERRHPHPDAGVWLAVLDIDHFKRVNDTYGHLIGDEVLLLLARLMRSSFRFHDQLYRFGGEEFVVLMRCDSAEHASQALERLREKVQAYAFPQVGTITVSIGFSVLLPHDTPSGAFGRADKAVYHAKEHGRNQVCSYQGLVASGDLVEQVAEGMDVDLF
ncbi:GGDEF domain-containing protein [Rhodoferax sp.]|uniref:GGDEF domain-containing protein n=1 Tax=Rhodoferax sp. TaxID=50421 RepID=UPI002ACD9C43|nr:GGDEF domain-containing protein [Rhodoferax sp.]MDZ7919736.1 GGDEF domain-containing protein [Rhodoferax sp.]